MKTTQNQISAAKAFNDSNVTDYIYESITEIKSCGSTCTFFDRTDEDYITVDDLYKVLEVLDNNQIDYIIEMGQDDDEKLWKEFSITIK